MLWHHHSAVYSRPVDTKSTGSKCAMGKIDPQLFMEVSIVDLRYHVREVLEALERREEVPITYH